MGFCDHLKYPENCSICISNAKIDKDKLAKLKEVEIVASYSGKIATGRFENEAPFFSIKETWTGDVNINEKIQVLSQKVYGYFVECEQRSLVDRIMAERKDIRFYDAGSGKKYPSITSVIGWDKDFFISAEDLVQYAARGTIVHKQVEIFIETGVWKPAKDIVELRREYIVVKKGKLQLELEGYHVDKLIKNLELETHDTETVSFNNEYGYAGRRDWKGLVQGTKTLIDFKTSAQLDKSSVLQQLAAHLFCPDNKDVEQVIAVPLNTTALGYGKPLIMQRKEMNEWFKLFLKSREDFKYRFNC